MIKLIVNADDFGYSRGVNHGIIDAYKYGIVNSTTMFVNMPGTEHAVELAKNNPGLRVGIHLTLTCGDAISPNVPSLTNDDGQFILTRDVQKDLKLEEIDKEWEAQIEHFLRLGLEPTHFDSHHHMHNHPELLPIVKRLSKKYDMPVRNVFYSEKVPGVKLLTDVFYGDFIRENVTEAYFSTLHERIGDVSNVEVMCHPGYIDQELINGSSYCEKRTEELEILINTRLSEPFVLV
ncbi:chitin disaccharide deacetylase [Pseudalkalibacillus salsuginis]|uniref:chitin disaccharide deacetylase n=1 Tax=Pseudalkalibacillus salsuginis TaxID=2910972 RepID=UPI001F3ECA82|nr:chitin disaccharide deacetylase [Pseudalkalibacillus salsuginis]MCF6409019.1 chitin disaccharide deacetylase [Pseudalkalibacillus salsuginis]